MEKIPSDVSNENQKNQLSNSNYTPIQKQTTSHNDLFISTMNNSYPTISSLLSINPNSYFSPYELSQKENIQIFKLILKNSSSTIRVEEKTELKFYLRKYLVKESSEELIIVNRDYKNLYKKK